MTSDSGSEFHSQTPEHHMPPSFEPRRISFAQNYEDARLWNALSDSSASFYVDIGAGHPRHASVTRSFYEAGWHGINVEPGAYFRALNTHRVRDINLNLAITRQIGRVPLYSNPQFPDLATVSKSLASSLGSFCDVSRKITVESTTLLDVFERFLPADQNIAFMKIDCEGSELDVVSSNDWDRFRPYVVLIESIEPITNEPNFAKWEPILLDAGYIFACDDGINRYYVDGRSSMSQELIRRLQEPISPVSNWETIDALDSEEQIRNLTTELRWAQARLLEADYFRKQVIQERQLSGAFDPEAMRVEIENLTQELELTWQQKCQSEEAVESLRSSRTWRVGRAATLPFRILRRGKIAVTGSAGSADQLASNHQDLKLLKDASSKTSSSSPTTLLDDQIYVDPYWQVLYEKRQKRPSLLSAHEWDLVSRFQDGAADNISLRQALTALRALSPLHEPVQRHSAPADRGRPTVVIDARPLQIPGFFGIKTVSTELFRSIAESCENRFDIQLILSAEYEPISLLDRFGRAYPEWLETTNDDVVAYFQLAPMMRHADLVDLALVSNERIRRVVFWYDFIPAHFPDQFLRTVPEFINYQYAVERLRLFDTILTLSEHVASEVRSLLSEVSDEDHDQCVEVVGCFSALETQELIQPNPNPDPTLVIFGNWLPHKNLEMGIKAAGILETSSGVKRRVLLLANLTPDQTKSYQELATEFGLTRLEFAYGIDDRGVSRELHSAEAVVVPSLDEGFSIPVVDALVSGTPVVAADNQAHRAIIGPGYWLPPGDNADSFASAIEYVLQHRNETWAKQVSAARPLERLSDFRRAATTTLGNVLSSVNELEEMHDPCTDSDSLSKVCSLRDFYTPWFTDVLQEVFSHEFARFGEAFPQSREWRKYWEVVMAVRTFESECLLTRDSTFLGIGAGNEPTIFYLTRHAKRVIATDLYDEDGWEESANPSMLRNPGSHWPFYWCPDRLDVKSMDALHLDIPDESVDGIFSSSSIEHFGSWDAVEMAMREAFRVLRPGGILSLSTEFKIAGDADGIPGVLMFDEHHIRRHLIESCPWLEISPFDGRVDRETLFTALPFERVVKDHVAKIAPVGALWTHHMQYEQYPHIVLNHAGLTWTSFHVALKKP